jgi:conjugal transfer ATP-binding protein TraC
MALNIFKKKKTENSPASSASSQVPNNQSIQNPQDKNTKPISSPQPLKSAQQTQTITQGSIPPQNVMSNQKPDFIDIVDAVRDKKIDLLDAVAPNRLEIEFDHLKIGDVFLRTLFISGYPRFVGPGWLEQIINFNGSLDISFFIYPIEGKGVLDDLMRKIAEMEAEISTDLERGKIINPATSAKLEDARLLQEELVKGAEHYFEFGFYVTIRAADIDHLNLVSKLVQATLGSLSIETKSCSLDMDNGFLSTAPFGLDRLSITRNMDTTSLATTFPLTSAELSADTGVLYGINTQNGSFIIFDRFSMENSNMTIFASSGAGKSYFVKLESVRSLMLGTEVIVIDPEGEYRALADAVGGQTIEFSFSSPSKINPFDLSQIYEENESHLNLKILSLHSLFKVIMGQISPIQAAMLDRALVETYKSRGITQEPETQKKEPPLMEDLYKILIGMEVPDALDLAARIEKFVRGSFIGIFDKQTNIEINNPFTVFSIRNLQDALRPIAMFIILEFIWTRVKRDLKPRLLVVDEAWHMMRFEDSAQFLWSIVKRARKYYLGITTITQDVDDFLSQDIGKAVVTNSALRVLFKQSPAAIDKVGDVFYLSQGERSLLLGSNVGEGIFFAGNNHAPITVVASPEEHKLITTRPQEILSQQSGSNRTEKGVTPAQLANAAQS